MKKEVKVIDCSFEGYLRRNNPKGPYSFPVSFPSKESFIYRGRSADTLFCKAKAFYERKLKSNFLLKRVGSSFFIYTKGSLIGTCLVIGNISTSVGFRVSINFLEP